MKFSIIIPIYNTSKYITECVDSILKQTYKNYEIILINDGSTDNSLEIINKLYKKLKNVKIIDKKNTGVSDSRNIGIKRAIGEWIIFVDSDDWLDANTLLKLDKIIDKDPKIETIIFGLKKVFENGRILSDNFESSYVTNKIALYDYTLSEKYTKKNKKFYGSCSGIGGKAFCKNTLIKNDIFFPNLNYCEDTYFNLVAYRCSKKIYIFNENLYFYRFHSDSVTHKYNYHLYDNSVNFLKIIDEFLKEENIKIDGFYYRAFELFKCCISNMMCKEKSYKYIKEEYLKLIDNEYFKKSLSVVRIKYLSLRDKIVFLLLKFNQLNLLYVLYKFAK